MPTAPEARQSINDAIFYLSTLKSGRIIDLHPEAALETIGRTLDIIVKALGIRNMPDGDLSAKIIRFIKLHYGVLFPGEIEYAFDLALAEKLEVNLEHFNSFDLKYITGVMNAYVKYRALVIKEKRQQERALPAGEADIKEKIRNARADTMAHIAQVYSAFCEGSTEILTPGHYYWPFMYDFLEKFGIIALTPDEKKKHFTKAGLINREKAAKNSMEGIVDKLLNPDISPLAEQRRTAKELALKDKFQQWRGAHFDLMVEMQRMVGGAVND